MLRPCANPDCNSKYADTFERCPTCGTPGDRPDAATDENLEHDAHEFRMTSVGGRDDDSEPMGFVGCGQFLIMGLLLWGVFLFSSGDSMTGGFYVFLLIVFVCVFIYARVITKFL